MKAFKTFIASAVAGVMALSFATSAFAALNVGTVDSTSKVSASGASSVAGQRTVLVVAKGSWNAVTNKLIDNPVIVYINQVDNADLSNTLAEMAGKNLTLGDYVVLVGNENGTIESDNFTAIKVVANQEDGTNLSWEVTMNSNLLQANGVVAKFYDKTSSEAVGDPTTLWWEDGVITGDGDFTFTAETTVSSDGYAGNTGLEISAGTVSGKN